MAIGPDSAEEAGRIWEALSKQKGSPSAIISQIEPPPEEDSQLNVLVRGIEIPLDQNPCVIAKAVLEGRPFNVRVSLSVDGKLQTDCKGGCCLRPKIGCYGGELLGEGPKSYAFAAVPLWGRGRVLGVILVDNLFNQDPIEEEDIQFLSMFANQAGLAIENGLLYRNLEAVHHELREAQAQIVHQEKMAALGELSNTVAHEIKNPLTAIGDLPVASIGPSPTKPLRSDILKRLSRRLRDWRRCSVTSAITHT